ncbi:MAG TPA: single-stranded-DNA-specific exonuclease RecJ [Methylophilus sp.]|nr:single-stranded-DNA-specific exonuclease RecJ [Methylophilus sp.]HQQ34241.1 single-stranded-DNA-specific exonuclease RecJ [Methylophilus sp.]
MRIVTRKVDVAAETRLVGQGVAPLLARILAARGVKDASECDPSLVGLLPPETLTNTPQMAKILANAIAANKKLLVVGDYDADGATATAVAIKGLRGMGAQVDFLVPNRFEYGYGLTPEIVALAAKSKPDFIITVDNGIASVDGVEAANALGIKVLVTDHHLPGLLTPDAACIVNPNQHGCVFVSKHLAGVGVMFYVLLALRAELRKRGAFAGKQEPNLTELLDLVALGTVADLVKLDANNRILVEQGLRRIRAGVCSCGVRALLDVAGRNPQKVTAQDLGFYVGPRLNAAGRLDDMTLGIQCLLANDPLVAQQLAQSLHDLNAERRNIEADMQDSAFTNLDGVDVENRYSISLYQPNWHQGVVGILASRLKEKYHRPTIAFADAGDGILKGSGRSVPGLHLRDALDMVSKRRPDLIVKFGGHAMAAGLSILRSRFDEFVDAFEHTLRELMTEAHLEAVIEIDGSLDANCMDIESAQVLVSSVWGQGFTPPLFMDEFAVLNQRIVGEKHLKLYLERQGRRIDAICFGRTEFLPERIQAVYQLQVNTYNGAQSVQLQIVHVG